MKIDKLAEILLKHKKPSTFFMQNKHIFPTLEQLIGVPQNQIHHKEGDVWTHTMMVLDEAAERRELVRQPLGFMLSALCHDFGKIVCTEEINGVIHAYRHEIEGIPIAGEFLEEIGADADLTDYVLNMVKLHMLPNIMAAAKSKTKSTNKLFDSSVEPSDLVQLAICDGLGKIPQSNSSEEFLLMRLRHYNEIMSRPYVTADDLIKVGICKNPDEVLEYSHKLRLAGVDKENALRQSIAYARKVVNKNEH